MFNFLNQNFQLVFIIIPNHISPNFISTFLFFHLINLILINFYFIYIVIIILINYYLKRNFQFNFSFFQFINFIY